MVGTEAVHAQKIPVVLEAGNQTIELAKYA